MTWLVGAEILPGQSAGTWATDGPTKLVLHTIEGVSIDSAISAYRSSNSWPHITYDPSSRRLVQHLRLSVPARSLANGPGPAETNRAGVTIQVELVGFAANAHRWPDAGLQAIADDIVQPIRRAIGLDARAMRCYGAGAGIVLAAEDSPIRMTAAQWHAYGGICGHQQVPENDHWDPGALDVARLLALTGGGQLIDPLTGTTTTIDDANDLHPAEEPPDMTPEQAEQLTELRDNMRILRHGWFVDPDAPATNVQLVSLIRSHGGGADLAAASTAELLAELARRTRP